MSSAQTDLRNALAPGSLICLDTNCLLYYFRGEMPWADSLRPVFEAKDGGDVRLFTSSMTLAELLARVDPSDQSAMLSAVRQYFDLVPVDDNIGIQAAGIRRASNVNKAPSPPVKTPDAVEMATAGETRSLLFITNDEKLTRMPQTVKALYLKELALDWLQDEFNELQAASATVALKRGTSTLQISFLLDETHDLMDFQPPLGPLPFLEIALKLEALIEGPCAVIGLAEGVSGSEMVRALRLLSSERPWLKPSIPDWVSQFTNKTHSWPEPGSTNLIVQTKTRITNLTQRLRNEPHDDDDFSSESNRAVPFIVVNTSRLDAEDEVNALDGNGQVAAHKKRQEILRRYLAPFKPVMPLLELDGARLWKAEAQNAHELDVDRFRKFFACAENVIGKENR